jgi:hypothetical protein
MPTLGLDIILSNEYYATEKNGLIDDLYSRHITTEGALEERIKETAKQFDELIKKNNELPCIGCYGEESRKTIDVMMLSAITLKSGKGKDKEYKEGETYKVGEIRAMVMIGKGIAKRL